MAIIKRQVNKTEIKFKHANETELLHQIEFHHYNENRTIHSSDSIKQTHNEKETERERGVGGKYMKETEQR